MRGPTGGGVTCAPWQEKGIPLREQLDHARYGGIHEFLVMMMMMVMMMVVMMVVDGGVGRGGGGSGGSGNGDDKIR